MVWLKILFGRGDSAEDLNPNPYVDTPKFATIVGSEEEEREIRARMEAELEEQRKALPRE